MLLNIYSIHYLSEQLYVLITHIDLYLNANKIDTC